MKAKKFLSWEMFLLIILILEFVIFGAKNPKFLMPRVLFASVNDFIAICFIALFVTFVMITGGIDIQAASIVGLTSIIIGVGWQDGGMNIWVASILAIVAAAVCGALSGFFIAYCGVQAMVVTLGGSFLYAGFALLVSNFSASEAYQGISGFPDSFKIISKFKLFGVIPSQLLVFIVLIIIAYILLHRTKYGRSIFLVGINQEAAEYSGINTRLVILSTYVLSAVSAAFAGIMLTSYLGTAKSDLGANLTLNIITAVVLGGTRRKGKCNRNCPGRSGYRYFKIWSFPLFPGEYPVPGYSGGSSASCGSDRPGYCIQTGDSSIFQKAEEGIISLFMA